MQLAWSNLAHDRLRFLVTILGIAFAVFLMVFEGSLLAGFARAASRIIDVTDADIWIMARGVSCIDFPAPLPRRFRDIALGVPGVKSVTHLVTGSGSWQKPSGARQTVIVVGLDRGVASAFRVPFFSRSHSAMPSQSIVIDRSNAAALGIISTPMEVEISQIRATVSGITDGFASFVGSPYVFSDFVYAVRSTRLSEEETVFLLVHTTLSSDHIAVRRALQRRLPEADIWTRDEFSRRARTFWLTQTGAGGSITLAALLGFLVGFAIVSQSIYATTMENIEEFATLKAMGASRGYVQSVVLVQALISGLAGSSIGLMAAFPMMAAARSGIAWLFTPSWLPVIILGAGLVMCALASLLSIRKAIAVEPGRVFRA